MPELWNDRFAETVTKYGRVSGVGSELGAFFSWCQWKILTAEAGFLAAARARLVFGSKALTISRTLVVPDSAIRFDCRLVSCISFLTCSLYRILLFVIIIFF